MKKIVLLFVYLLCVVAATAVNPSGALPVMYINTTDKAPIVSKEDYLTATYYLDSKGLDGYQSIGSADAPLTMRIKGRGNYTWSGFDKKPYRLKLDTKQPLLGMKKSKHFGLLAAADDNLGFLRNTVGFEVSRMMELEWTPSQQPVEVVLNGDYIGLYFLTELIRVDADRVNVVEQVDGETLPENITGGWLVEIDNYDDDFQIKINENKGNGEVMRFTHKTPEVLSQEQKDYLTNLVTAVDEAIYNEDKSSTDWENYIDINELAKFYIVQEVTDNGESFHGSCYWHKERGADTKLKFGPVWDFGNSFQRQTTNSYIFENTPFHQHWIGEIVKYPAFQTALKEQWKLFMQKYPSLDAFIEEFISKVTPAAATDYERWNAYGNRDMTGAKNSYLEKLHAKVEWLNDIWGDGSSLPGVTSWYMVGASTTLGSWQPGAAPKFSYDEQKEIYTLHLDNVDNLQSGFKIIDRRDWTGDIQMCSNGETLKLNEDYYVSTTINDPNITMDVDVLENVDVTIRKVNGKWVIRISDEIAEPEPVYERSEYLLHTWEAGCPTLHGLSDKYFYKRPVISDGVTYSLSLIFDNNNILTFDSDEQFVLKNETETEWWKATSIEASTSWSLSTENTADLIMNLGSYTGMLFEPSTGKMKVTSDKILASSINVSEKQILVRGGNNCIVISLDGRKNVSVYTISGQLVASQTVNNSDSIILSSGFYVVKVGNYVTKVAVK